VRVISVRQASPDVIGSTAPWDLWDASPPTLEIMGTKCIWSPPTSATSCHSTGHRWSFQGIPRPPNSIKWAGQRKRVGKEWEKRGRATTEGTGRNDRGGKGTGRYSFPRTEVPSYFSTAIAPVLEVAPAGQYANNLYLVPGIITRQHITT